MSAEVLRKAAALMRERAEAANPGGPGWETAPDEMHGPSRAVIYPADSDSAVAFAGSDDAEHIASWHPAVAMTVADLLDAQAALIEETGGFFDIQEMGDANALAVARAYLGSDS